MAGNEGGSGNNMDPKTAESVAKSMQAVKQSATEASKALGDQIQIFAQLQASMQAMAGNMAKICDSSDKCFSPEKWQSVTKEAQKLEKQTTKTESVMQNLAKVMKSKLTQAATVAVSALDGLGQGFRNLFALLKGVGGVVGGVVDGLFSIAKGILSIPFKILGGLMDMASSGGGGNELAAAYEKVRTEFGALSSVSSKAIISTSKELKGFNDTGLNSFRVFGNLAQKMEYVTEVAKGMGPQFAKHANEFEENGGALLAYQKGLGITAEQMNTIAGKADMMGVKMGDVLGDITKQSLGMAKAFGLDAKVISKDMGKAMADVKNFGHLSTKELASAVVYANKLGVSIDKLTGLMDSFDTFDSAAESTSKLNEAFGTNINAQEIMSAQDPSSKMEILRKQFAATGKDMTKLSYQERKLIQQTTGLDAATMDAMLANKDQGDMMKKITKEGDKVEGSVMDQATAMSKLSDQIERIAQSGGTGASGGIFSHIIEGLQLGIKSSPAFLGMMSNIRQTLRSSYEFGIKMGKAFVDLFPGVKQIFGGIKDLFDPKKFKDMFGQILGVVDDFKKGNIKSFTDVIEKIKSIFFSFFDKSAGPGKKVLEGFKEFGIAALNIIGGIADWMFTELAGLVDKLVAWIKKPQIPNVNASGMGNAIKTPMEKAIISLTDKLLPALGRLAEVLWEKLKDALLHTKTGHAIIAGAAAIILGPALLRGVIGAVSGGLFNKAGKALFGGLMGGAKNAAAADGGKSVEQIAKAAAPVSSSPSAMMSSSLPDPETLKKMQDATSNTVDWGKLTAFLVGMAGVFAIGLGAFKIALLVVKDVSIEDIGKAAIVFGAVAGMFIPMGVFLKAASGLQGVTWQSLLTVFAGMAFLLLEGIGAFALALKVVKDVSIEDIGKATLLFLAMVPMYGAAATIVLMALGISKLIKQAFKEVAVGMGTMAATVAILVGTAWLILKSFEGFNPASIEAAAIMMEAISNVYMKVGVILVEAAAIGAAIISSMGVAAGAAAAGMAAMAAGVLALSATAVVIMESLSKIKEDPAALKIKAETFVLIVNAVGDLMQKIANIIKAMDFSAFGSAADKAKQIDSVTEMIKTLLDGQNGNGGINQVIKQLIVAVKIITPDKIEPLKAFAEVIKSIGDLMGKIGDVTGKLAGESTSWIDSLSGKRSENLRAGFSGAAVYIESMMKGVIPLIRAIAEAMAKIGRAENIEKSAQAISTIFQALTGLIQGMAPDVSKFQKTKVSGAGFWSGGVKQAEVDSAGITAAATYMEKVLGAVTEKLLPFAKKLIGSVTSSLSGLKPEQISGLAPLAEIIKAITGLAGTLSSSTKDAGNIKVDAAQGAIVSVVSSFPSISDIFDKVKDSIPQLVSSMMAVTKTIPSGQEFKNKLETVSSIFSTFGKISELSKIIGDIPDPGNKGKSNSFLEDTLGHVMGILSALAGDTWNGYYSIKYVAGYLQKIGDYMGKGTALVDTSKKLGEMLSGIGSSFSGITSGLNSIEDKGSKGKSNAFLEDTFGHVMGIFSALAGASWGEKYSLKFLVDYVKKIGEYIGKDTSAIDGIKKLGDLFKEMGPVLSSMSNSTKDLEDGPMGIGNAFLSQTMENLNFIFTALAEPSGNRSINTLMTKFKDVSGVIGGYQSSQVKSTFIPDVVNLLKDVEKGIDPAVSLFDNIKAIDNMPRTLDSVKNMVSGAQRIFDQFKTSVPGQAVAMIKTVEEVVTAIQKVDEALAKGTSVDIKTKLEEFAGKMGLGSSGIYTVRSKEVLLTVNLNVTMDTGKVESAIIKDNRSIIRDRINFLLEQKEMPIKDNQTMFIHANSSNNSRFSGYSG